MANNKAQTKKSSNTAQTTQKDSQTSVEEDYIPELDGEREEELPTSDTDPDDDLSNFSFLDDVDTEV